MTSDFELQSNRKYHGISLMLAIIDATLPNQTLLASWYNGSKFRHHYLVFDGIAIAAIEADAFLSPAFSFLAQLSIYSSIHIVDYHLEIFTGLQRLIRLEFEESTAHQHNMPMAFLQPLITNLNHFGYEGDIGDEPVLTNLFGSGNMPALKSFGIMCQGKSNLSHVAAANFTGLSAILRIALNACGIKTIELDAFVGIVDTLISLVILQNPLLVLNLATYRPFLDQWKPHDFDARTFLHFSDRKGISIICTPEYYRIRNASIISIKYQDDNFIQDICKDDIHDIPGADKQQTVHPQRWQLNHSDVWKYVFPKFNLHFNAADRTLSVIQYDPYDYYRVFIWPIERSTAMDQQKCPSTAWIAANVKCQHVRRSVESIIIADFEKATKDHLIAACVIHISIRKQSVPLHCRTMSMPVSYFVVIYLYVALLFLLLAIGSTLIFAWKRHFLTENNGQSHSGK